MPPIVRTLSAIADALKAGRPVVALESSVLAQGLPIPQNRHAAVRMVRAVESNGAVAAITAVVKGTPTAGLEPEELERFLARDGVRKVSARDLAIAIASGHDGATTVAATLAVANSVGIGVFATGGIGGVHRDAPYDESADLAELARTPMIVVCAGAKSILDLPATWERLESYGVPVIGFQTNDVPGFFTTETGIRLDTRADDVETVVRVWRAHQSLGRRQALLVVQPPPAAHALDRHDVEAAVSEAQRLARREGVTGAQVTPYLLSAVTRLTGGASLEANLALLERNADLAGRIAAQVAATV
jgi:pseudouridine-5'-phosphate glycosidase